jgi:diacylglycerol kinase (ATP)
VRAVIIHNPSSGVSSQRAALAAAMDCLREIGWTVSASETANGGDATRLAREAADKGTDVAFAVGGDGTVNEVLNGILGSETALAVLPLGTANVWALEMGLPLDNLARAAQSQANALPRTMDVGIAEGAGFAPRAFLLWCGAGLDASVIRQVEHDRFNKRRFGKLFFIALGIREALQYRGRRIAVSVDGKTFKRRALQALTSNAQLYGALVRIPPDARVDDGMLDVTILHGDNALHTAWHFLRLGMGFFEREPDIEHYRGRRIEIRGDVLAVHVDAEPVGTTPVQIHIQPRALRVLVPATANQKLFKDGE